MSVLTRVIVAVMVILAIGTLYLSKDESLSETAESWVAAQENSGVENDAYLLLLGLDAAPEDDAIEIGRVRLAKLRAAHALGPDFIDPYPQDKQIVVPSADDDDLYCVIRDVPCLDLILADSLRIEGQLKNFRVLLDRYRLFLQSEGFQTLTPIGDEVPERFRHLMVGNRLAILDAFAANLHGEAIAGVQMLLQDVGLLRSHLVQSDDLIHKLVTVRMMSDTLDAIAYLHDVAITDAFAPIPMLEVTELDSGKPLRREFLYGLDWATALDQHPNLFSDEIEMPEWVVRLVYKPNRLINQSVAQYGRLVELSKLDNAQFAARIDDPLLGREHRTSWHPQVANFEDEVLDVDHVREYLGRIHDLNAKIALTNQVLTMSSGLPDNPYYASDEPGVEEPQEGDTICLAGPLDNDKRIRCLNFYLVRPLQANRT